MRLLKPEWISKLPLSKPSAGSETSRAGKLPKAIIGVLMLVLAIAAIKIIWDRSPVPVTIKSENASDATIRMLKDSKVLDDQRAVISSYSNNGDYNSAVKLARQVATQTRQYQDYMVILNLCALRNVTDKETCINEAVSGLKPLIGQIPFMSAYSAGGLLEKSNHKKDAADFYQRAYDVYESTGAGDVPFMTKDQLKTRINELRK